MARATEKKTAAAKKAAPKKKELTKEEQIKKEQRRLRGIFKDLDANKKKLVTPLSDTSCRKS